MRESRPVGALTTPARADMAVYQLVASLGRRHAMVVDAVDGCWALKTLHDESKLGLTEWCGGIEAGLRKTPPPS